MIFKDNLYTVNGFSEKDGLLEAGISIHSNHAVFSGHFPDNPVTPGVVQIEIIKELLSVYYNRSLNLKSITNCKFLAILNPNIHPEVIVKIKCLLIEDGTIKISGSIVAETITFLQIQSVFIEENK